MISAAYASGFGPEKKVQTFSDEADRERLKPAAVAGVRKLAADWRLTGAQIAALLAVSPTTWDRIVAGTWEGSFNQDQMTRVSALVGIYKGLHLLFADDMADRWPVLANSGPLFGGPLFGSPLFGSRSAVDAMIEGGIPVMLEVRRYVDAVRGG